MQSSENFAVNTAHSMARNKVSWSARNHRSNQNMFGLFGPAYNSTGEFGTWLSSISRSTASCVDVMS